MPRTNTDQVAISDALKKLPLTSELFEEQNGKLKYGSDLDIIIHGRELGNGKKVGPYVRLLIYDSGEEIMREGDWGGNIFYVLAEGTLDVYVRDSFNNQDRIAQLQPGTCFGEMSVLAG